MSGSRMKPSAKPAAPFSSHRPIGAWRLAFAITAGRSCATAGCMVSMQFVLMEFSALHDGGEIFSLLLKQSKIFQRVTVDQQQVRVGTGLQRSELAVLPNDARADRCGGADDLDRRHHLRADCEFAALLDL